MSQHVAIGLNAVIVAANEGQPKVLVVKHTTETLLVQQGAVSQRTLPSNSLPGERDSNNDLKSREALPFGPFYPERHRTLEEGLRSWVAEQTQQELGYVEQLYTFGDQGRVPGEELGGPRVISVGYLGLVNETTIPQSLQGHAVWHDWYDYFPWEDWRSGEPAILQWLKGRITEWASAAEIGKSEQTSRLERASIVFGLNDTPWNGRMVLERYELLYEAGLVAESPACTDASQAIQTGRAMTLDHRRILATAMGRLRGKIKYRPVVFELMPESFTLLQLQRCVEGLSGEELHKQNFRRLVESKGLVETTGRTLSQTGGRPAAEFRFRREVLRERQALGF